MDVGARRDIDHNARKNVHRLFTPWTHPSEFLCRLLAKTRFTARALKIAINTRVFRARGGGDLIDLGNERFPFDGSERERETERGGKRRSEVKKERMKGKPAGRAFPQSPQLQFARKEE